MSARNWKSRLRHPDAEVSSESALAEARSALYSFLSRALVPPTPEMERIAEPAWSAASEVCAYLDEAFGTGLGESLAGLRESYRTLTREELADQHVHLFGHTASGPCPPYETEYGRLEEFQKPHEMADIAGFYRAFGLDVSAAAAERPDHVCVEIEFMHFLAYKERHALEHHGPEQVSICREAQRKFLAEHLSRWMESFADKAAAASVPRSSALRSLEIASSSSPGAFYALLARFVSAFMRADLTSMEGPPARP